MTIILQRPFKMPVTNQRSFLREPFLSASHLFGAFCSLIAVIYLIIQCGEDRLKLIAVAVYGATLISLLLASGLCHGVHCSDKNLMRLERWDYMSIYLFIAGTYTPICLFILKDSVGMGILILEWVLACIGVFTTLRWGFASKTAQITIFLTMGWIFLFSCGDMIRNLNNLQLVLLFLGVASYSIGSFIFAYGSPHWQYRKICTHSIWHIFVLMGTTAHFLMICSIVLP